MHSNLSIYNHVSCYQCDDDGDNADSGDRINNNIHFLKINIL